MTREQKLVEAHDAMHAARQRRFEAEAMQKAARKVVSQADKEYREACDAEEKAIRAILEV